MIKADLFTCAMFLALLGPAPCVAFAAALGWGVLLCSGCLCLSMGLYQGYIEFAIGLLLLCMLRDCLTRDLRLEKTICQGTQLWFRACCWAAYCMLCR